MTVLTVILAIIAAFIIILFISPIRIFLLTKPLMKWFGKQQPPLSSTEREALYAGGSWFEKEIFTGKPNWQKLAEMPKYNLTAEEQSFLDNEVVTLCEMLDDWKINHEIFDLSPEAWRYIKEKKFWGLVIAKKHGGLGFSAQLHSAVICKIASKSITAAINVMVPNSLGPAEFIHFYGSEEQKQKYLSKLACGEEIACFALTSNEAGSDASRISDRGEVCYGEFNGEKTLGIKLNFHKRYITLAPICTLIGLAFKLYDPQKLLGGEENLGITCALVPANLPGVKKGERHLPMNLYFMNGPLEGKDVFIPIDYVIGGRDNCGKGWRMLMECLSIGRGISLPSLATAATHLSLRTTSAYAQLRWQFKRPISDFEGIALPLGNIAGLSYLCEATRNFNALAVDQNSKPSLASAIAKYNLTEFGRVAVNHAMDIHGGRAVQMGPKNYLGALYQGVPICITVEGANILTRNLIIFGQGVVRSHPYLQQEIEAAEKNDAKKFDKLIWKHLRFAFRNAGRAHLNAIFPSRDLIKQLDRMSSALVFISEISLALLGAKLKVKESLSARLGDVLSNIYTASAALKYYQDQGKPQQQEAFFEWSVRYCLYNAQTALYDFLQNFPYPKLAKFLCWFIFPWGRSFKGPSDKLTLKLNDTILQNNAFRMQLTRACYISKNRADAAGFVEAVYTDWLAIKPLWKKCEKLCKNINSLSSEDVCIELDKLLEQHHLSPLETQQLKKFVMERYDALQVDAFNLMKNDVAV